jgi:hypothetical protein
MNENAVTAVYREIYKFKKLKIRLAMRREDILFLRSCKRDGLIPKFIDKNILSNVKSEIWKSVVREAKNKLLLNEIRHQYYMLNKNEVECYSINLSLMKKLEQSQWLEIMDIVNAAVNKSVRRKVFVLQKKFENLWRQKCRERSESVGEINFVINKSCAEFSEKEMKLLNKGLKMQLYPEEPPTNEIIVAVESCIKDLPFEKKASIRNDLRATLEQQNEERAEREDWKTVKALRAKDVMYVNPDKGKAVVVLDRVTYEEAVNEHLTSGAYSEVKTRAGFPIDSVQRTIKKRLKELCERGVINEWKKDSLVLPNPTIPNFSLLPKIHKKGNKFRPLVSSINAPTERICQHLLRTFKKFEKPWSLAIRNSYEAVERIKRMKLKEGQKMISLDVESLFPSVPLEEAYGWYKMWIREQNTDENEKELCIELMGIVLDCKWLQYGGKIFAQNEGLFIGNAMSPILTEVFMGALEKKIHKEEWFPDNYMRYVDDVFCVIEGDGDHVLEMMNAVHPSIKFTLENEANNQLSFLDLKLVRNGMNIEIDIHRKETDAPLMIPKTSKHHPQHQHAAFESACYRLCNLPLNDTRHRTELDYIKRMGRINGYKEETIVAIYKKHKLRSDLRKQTTLKPTKEKKKLKSITTFRGTEKNKIVVLPYYPAMTNEISKILRRHNLNVVFNNRRTLRTLLNKTKSRQTSMHKSGIYKIECNDCEKSYIGQTKRRFERRNSEHNTAIKNRATEKSAVAQHCIENNHTRGDGKVIKEIKNPVFLDAWESLCMNTTENLMNLAEAPIHSSLFKYARADVS